MFEASVRLKKKKQVCAGASDQAAAPGLGVLVGAAAAVVEDGDHGG